MFATLYTFYQAERLPPAPDRGTSMPENAPACALTPDPRSLQVRTASSLDIARNAQPFDSPRLARTAILDTLEPTMPSSSQEVDEG